MTDTLVSDLIALKLLLRTKANSAGLDIVDRALDAVLCRDSHRAALMQIAEEHDAGRHDGKPEPCPARTATDMWLIARGELERAK